MNTNTFKVRACRYLYRHRQYRRFFFQYSHIGYRQTFLLPILLILEYRHIKSSKENIGNIGISAYRQSPISAYRHIGLFSSFGRYGNYSNYGIFGNYGHFGNFCRSGDYKKLRNLAEDIIKSLWVDQNFIISILSRARGAGSPSNWQTSEPQRDRVR